MSNLPDCMYEYRYESPSRKLFDICDICRGNIYEGNDYYSLNGEIICCECMNEFKHIAEIE